VAKGTDTDVPEIVTESVVAAISAPPTGVTPSSAAAAERTVEPILPSAPFTATVISGDIVSVLFI
jgi:hypothetical protein